MSYSPKINADANWSDLLKKHSITIRGHRTSFSIEDEFYRELIVLAESENKPLARLVSQIDDGRSSGTNLSSAIRLYVLEGLKARTNGGGSENTDP